MYAAWPLSDGAGMNANMQRIFMRTRREPRDAPGKPTPCPAANACHAAEMRSEGTWQATRSHKATAPAPRQVK